MAIALLLLSRHLLGRKLALLLVILLHGGICLTPFPNQERPERHAPPARPPCA